MHYTITHSYLHRKPPCLLTKTPFTRSKPRILSHQGLSNCSKIPFLPLMLLKKAIWPTFPPPLKSTFPLKMTSSKKSPLELLALLKKSPHIKPSSRNIGIFSPSHTQKFLASIPLLLNIASTLGPTLHQFSKNSDRYIHPKPWLSKPKLTSYALSGSFTPSPIPHRFPTLYPLKKNRALSMFAQTFMISIMHVRKTTFQCLSSIKLSMIVLTMRLYPLWMDSLVIIKSKFTPPISIKMHSLPLGIRLHIVSCLLA
jgi:hypothetical protein